jgi:hypothetical protein
MTFMRTISLGTGSLSRLIATQKALGGSDFESVIAQAMSEVSQELGITAPPKPEETGNNQADFILKLFSRAKDEE